MKHHYTILAEMRYNALCPMGALCSEDELNDILKQRDVRNYKIKMIDRDPIPDWEKADWIPVEGQLPGSVYGV
jgi:hypothetical protein